MSEILKKAEIIKKSNLNVSEILFGALLAFVAVSGIWFSSTLMLHLFKNL